MEIIHIQCPSKTKKDGRDVLTRLSLLSSERVPELIIPLTYSKIANFRDSWLFALLFVAAIFFQES